jgi:quercetin dioxygenase-like cupin family protein
VSQSLWFLDTLVDIHIGGESTGGAYGLVECLAPSGYMPPPHVHEDVAEGILVLEGELTVHTATGPHRLGAGVSLHAPASEPHTIEVTSAEPCRWLVVSSLAGFEEFVRAFGTPAERRELPALEGPPDVSRLTAVAAEHGIRFVGALTPA